MSKLINHSASVFSEISDSDVLEESCYQAIKQGINDMSKFQNLVREVESAESV